MSFRKILLIALSIAPSMLQASVIPSIPSVVAPPAPALPISGMNDAVATCKTSVVANANTIKTAMTSISTSADLGATVEVTANVTSSLQRISIALLTAAFNIENNVCSLTGTLAQSAALSTERQLTATIDAIITIFASIEGTVQQLVNSLRGATSQFTAQEKAAIAEALKLVAQAAQITAAPFGTFAGSITGALEAGLKGAAGDLTKAVATLQAAAAINAS